MERFWSKVAKGDGCWEWTAYRDGDGYGQFYLDGGMRLAHRVAYQMSVGAVPAGLELDHLCRNPGCVNPAHLEPVTHAENILRWRQATRATHCRRGHEFDEANTYVYRGKRHCRICAAAKTQRYRARKKAAA